MKVERYEVVYRDGIRCPRPYWVWDKHKRDWAEKFGHFTEEEAEEAIFRMVYE